MKWSDAFFLAFSTLRANKLRALLTISIIALGIMALIGIITAIKAMSQKFSDSFSTMGANSFTIRYKERSPVIGGEGNREIQKENEGKVKEKMSVPGKRITEEEAELFAEQYLFPAVKSISLFGGRNNMVSYEGKRSNPNVVVVGGDENYIALNGFEVLHGRNMSEYDVQPPANDVCLLGYDAAKNLFKENLLHAIDAGIRVNNQLYRVLGVLKSRGNAFGFSRDNIIIMPYPSVKRNFVGNYSFVIGIMAKDVFRLDAAMAEAEGVFRSVRMLSSAEDNNFVVDRSDSIAQKAMESLRFLTVSATVIGLITLIGAAIGLMNIMLVALAERTREIGLAKAIGAKNSTISWLFLLEAVIISLIGSLLGILLGVIVGNVFTKALQTGFVVPWGWVLYGIFICFFIGILAGIYPALKAGKLSPVAALRYE